MNILVMACSSRIRGNTRQAACCLEDALRQKGQSVEHLDLAACRIQTCLGCRLCFDRGEHACPLKDDVQSIYERIRASDLLVMAFPVYVEDVSGLVKNWIDRMAFLCHRPALHGTKVFFLATAGSAPSSHAISTARRAFMTWGARDAGSRTLLLGATTDPDTFGKDHAGTIRSDAVRLVSFMTSARSSFPSFLQLLTFRIQRWYYLKNPAADTFDHTYWKEKGWLDPARKYALDTRVGFWKYRTACILAVLVERILLR